ncbi:hypothetical protein [Clostridium sp.]|uniref:DUF6115 domain-containing protein n=1 Tax=Clostridium sp. TaxID=1506 RepID=UPI001A4B14A3|nr:hypothetical protein [Clostridium sp.]MBK5240423.1 hypothetical protein [Clostridium sp.]
MPWLLIFIGLILVILNVLAIKKHNRSFNGVLGNAMGNINDEDIRIGELRREFSESILELQSEIMDMKRIMGTNIELHNNSNELHKTSELPKEDSEIMYNKKESIIAETNISNSNSEKTQQIIKLFEEGYSEDSISEMLHLGKGEVLLIKDLYIR